MSTSVPTSGGIDIGDIAKLIPALQSLFLGSGKTTGTSGATTAGGGTLTQGQASTIDPTVMQSLLTQMSTAFGNSQDYSKLQPIIDSILQQSKEAFAPQLGAANASGLYNSSTLGNLAAIQQRNAANLIFQSLTKYGTDQQGIAAQVGGTLANATKSVATNQATTDSKKVDSTDIKNTQPVINLGGNNLPLTLGIGAAGLGAKALFSETGKKFFDSLFGGGGGEAGADSAVSTPAAIDAFSGSRGSLGALTDMITAGGGATAANPIVSEANAGLLNFQDSVGGLNTFQDVLSPTSVSGLGNLFPSSGSMDLGAASGLDVPTISDLYGGLSYADSFPEGSGFVDSGAFDLPAAGVADNSTDFFPELGIYSTTSSTSNAAADAEGSIFHFNPIGLGAGIAGSLLGGFASRESGGNPIGGSIVGTAGGVIGSIFGPIGTFAGSLLGNVIGGFFGQHHPENQYSGTQLKLNSDYSLALGPTVSQRSPNDDQYRQAWQKQIDALNNYAKSAGVKIANPSSYTGEYNSVLVGEGESAKRATLGFSNPNEGDTPRGTYSDLSKAFQDLRFTSDNPELASKIEGKAFIDINQLNDVITGNKNYSQSPLYWAWGAPSDDYVKYLSTLGLTPDSANALNPAVASITDAVGNDNQATADQPAAFNGTG